MPSYNMNEVEPNTHGETQNPEVPIMHPLHDQSIAQKSPIITGRAEKIIIPSIPGVKFRAENLVESGDYGGNLKLGDISWKQQLPSCSADQPTGPTSQKSILATEEGLSSGTSEEIPEPGKKIAD